jgi:hypothetical protein
MNTLDKYAHFLRRYDCITKRLPIEQIIPDHTFEYTEMCVDPMNRTRLMLNPAIAPGWRLSPISHMLNGKSFKARVDGPSYDGYCRPRASDLFIRIEDIFLLARGSFTAYHVGVQHARDPFYNNPYSGTCHMDVSIGYDVGQYIMAKYGGFPVNYRALSIFQ